MGGSSRYQRYPLIYPGYQPASKEVWYTLTNQDNTRYLIWHILRLSRQLWCYFKNCKYNQTSTQVTIKIRANKVDPFEVYISIVVIV